jgi:chorismate synthase
MLMWYLGVAFAFLAGYLYQSSRADAIALAAAALASSFLGEYLSVVRKSSRYRLEAEKAKARMASLHVEAEEAMRAKRLAEHRLEELKQEIRRLRGMLPVEREKRERIERIISEVDEL